MSGKLDSTRKVDENTVQETFGISGKEGQTEEYDDQNDYDELNGDQDGAEWEEDEEESVDENVDSDDDEGDREFNNEAIINSLSNFVANQGGQDEDLPTYKAKMKVLLEQLMLKLEEDVDYQKNLEQQIEDLEKELSQRDTMIDRLTRQARDSIEDCKAQTEDLADEMMAKLKSEKARRASLEKVVIRMQNEIARLQSDLRIEKLKQQNPTASGRSSIQVPPIPPISILEESSSNDSANQIQELTIELQVARDEIAKLKEKRNTELQATLILTKKFQEAIDEIKLKSAIPSAETESNDSTKCTLENENDKLSVL